MYHFDNTSKPPAPYLEVFVRHPQTRAEFKVAAKLDTGASKSAIPAAIAVALNLETMGKLMVQGFNQVSDKYPVHYVELEVADLKLPMFPVIALPRKDILLGRDILNHFIITLDGKALTFDIRDP
ncbi:MAG: retroviral-like aspartic protease family protein [Chloroflexi bacterium]|nr:retroviral-like aspartic protease family protein [Chloroflexota bacterium]